jgi:hypothetical protein
MGELADLIEVEGPAAVIASALELRLTESLAAPGPRRNTRDASEAGERLTAGSPRRASGSRHLGPSAEHPENRSALCADGSVGGGAIGGLPSVAELLRRVGLGDDDCAAWAKSKLPADASA